MRQYSAADEVPSQFFFVPGEFIRRHILELKTEHLHTLDEHQVERDARDDTGGESDGDEPPAAAERSQCGFGQLTADRVDDRTRTVGHGVAQRAAEVTRLVVDEVLRAVTCCPIKLFGR